jgi:hypothetical protein
VCTLSYDICRQAVLRDHIWNFARKYKVISMDASEAPPFNFSARYKLPNDCLRIVRLYEEEDIDRLENPTSNQFNRTNLVASDDYPYDIVGDFLYLNSEALSLDIIYIYDMTNVDKFDRLFVHALAAKLAYEIAPKVVSKDRIALKEEMRNEYNRLIMNAKGVQGTEKRVIRQDVGSFVMARNVHGTRDPRRWY